MSGKLIWNLARKYTRPLTFLHTADTVLVDASRNEISIKLKVRFRVTQVIQPCISSALNQSIDPHIYFDKIFNKIRKEREINYDEQIFLNII